MILSAEAAAQYPPEAPIPKICENTGFPVRVSIDDQFDNPLVYFDRGSLYRMLRNLLRDAVTHGEGNVITPTIQIEKSGNIGYLRIYSPGSLPSKVLKIIGKKPYSSSGEAHHGFGKVNAKNLLTDFLKSLGMNDRHIEELMQKQWQNVQYSGKPHVRWQAPFILA